MRKKNCGSRGASRKPAILAAGSRLAQTEPGHWPASGRGRRLDPCITEVEMPGATRFDLTRALREQDGRTKAAFIAVTRLKAKIGTIIL